MALADCFLAPKIFPVPAPDQACPVVGVGASAGGLEALTHLLGAFGITTGMALIVVSHLDPDYPSMLAELLAKTTSLFVQIISDGVQIEPDHVYVMPPNTTLQLVGRVLRLSPRADSPHPHMPIDRFFQSLAAVNGAASIGVVLSGTGMDGTLGLCAIKAVEGTTLAQTPESSAYPQMPQSAISAGCVDLVLPPVELAAAIVRRAESSRAAFASADASESLDADENLLELFVLVQEATGIDFSSYKSTTILRRLRRRMALHQQATLELYLQFLHDHPNEVQALARDCLIGVTEFFRDPDAFATLQQTVLIPLLQQRSADMPVRVWVIGCATGQEAYSLAMLLLETAEIVNSAVPFQIFATDINDMALAIARAGVYSAASAQGLSPSRRERFLTPVEHGYRVASSLREYCVFARHNLLSDPPFSTLDIICCRNVLIYLGRPFQQQVIPMLHYALNPGGVLMLGASEQLLDFDDLFTPINSIQRLYVRTGLGRTFVFSALPSIQSRATLSLSRVAPIDSERDHVMQQTAHRIMATHYARAGVLITSGYDILHIYGSTGRYLEPAPGETTVNVLRMARDGLLAAIQQTVEQAAMQQTVARIEWVRLLTPGETGSLTLEVTPIRDPHIGTMLFLIVFVETPSAELAVEMARRIQDPSASVTNAWRDEVQALRAELAASKMYLRTIITEQVATNDELKLLNEELLSRNEQVQSVNAELQTAKEEMQSMNEELITVNEELQQRNREISAINGDFQRLLASIDIPIVMLDRAGTVSRFTPPAAQLLRLQPTDVGHPLRDDSSTVPGLAALIADVQQRGRPAEVPLNGHNAQAYLLRIWPSHSVDGTIDGTVLVWIDVAALKQAEATRRNLELGLLEAQRLESLGMLAGGVAHDFNNLLAIIMGSTQLALLDLDPDEPAYESLQQIESTSARASELTRQMLVYAGKSQPELKVVDLNELIEATDSLLRASIGKQIALHYILSSAPLWTQIDITQIRQMLVNLVLNAAEAASGTALIVTVRSEERWFDRATLATFQVGAQIDSGRYVVLEVVDTGIGMAPVTVARIFEPFFSTKFTGRGLGLASIRGIVQGHNGAIHVQSSLGHGTTMTVVLPRAPQTAMPKHNSAQAQVQQPAAQQIPHRFTVLVIDDEDGVRSIAMRLLERLGFVGVVAADGAAGIAEFQHFATEVALVLLDMTMPGLNTRQIIQALRAIHADIPILLMSGYPQDSVEDLFETAGFLAKPFTLKQLQDALQAVRMRHS